MTAIASSNIAATCPVCGDHASWPIPFLDEESGERLRRTSGYRWCLCRKCGTAYPFPPPSLQNLQAYWDRNRVESDFAPVTEEVWRGRLQASRVWAQRTYDFVVPHVRSNTRRFLDIACGLGATVALFGEKGWSAEGVDADPNAREFHQRLGIRSSIGQIENVDTANRYDLVGIAHAIYFITDPRGFVRRVREMLESDGLFVIILSDLLSTLCAGSPQYAHTWYPTVDSLAYLLAQEGFDLVETRTTHGSILVLARKVARTPVHPQAYPRYAHLLFLSHGWRYRLIGQPIIWIGRRVKRTLGVGRLLLKHFR
jgi:SAM-dependent methyltransferase